MRGTYTIAVEPERDLIRISLSGFFDIETIQALARDRRPVYARLTCAPSQHLTLCDISGCNLQSQEALAVFRQVMTGDRSLFSRKLAFFTGSSLARMQVRRILEREAAACFATEAEALDWLFQPESVASVA